MNVPPIQIRNDEVARDIRDLAERTGLTITEAVASAVRTELARIRRSAVQDSNLRQRTIDDALRRFREAPSVGEALVDDDLYDEHGLPR